MNKIRYSFLIALSDAVKSLRYDSKITTMRVVVLALFVASFLIVGRLMLAIYYEERAKQDPITFKEIHIATTGKVDDGTDSFGFTEERLETLKLNNAEIKTIDPFYTLLPKVQYKEKVVPNPALYSTTKNDVLFEKERMIVGRGPQDENETTLTRNLANRLGVTNEDVKNEVEITTTYKRKRDQKDESFVERLKVVGICRGSEEAGYILTSRAATINAWQASDLASIDGRDETAATETFVYYREEQFPRIEEFAKNTKLELKKLDLPLNPNLKNSTWARVNPNYRFPNLPTYPTYIVKKQNDLFVVIDANDERIKRRKQIIVETESIDPNKEVWQGYYVKDDCDLYENFGINPEEGTNVRILSRDECKDVVFDGGTTLADWIDNPEKSEKGRKIFVKLNANVKEDADFYQKACFYDAITPYTAQTFGDLNVCEVKATSDTPKDTTDSLVENLRPLGAYVKEKLEVVALLNRRFVRLTAKDSKAPENRNRRDEEFQGTRTLELSVEDARDLGAIALTKGSDVVLSFTSERNQTIKLTFRYVGLNVYSEISSEDAKDILAWQRGKLVYDESEDKFVVPSVDCSISKTYNARIVAKSTEDALKLIPKLQNMGYRVKSNIEEIENAKRLAVKILSFLLLFNGVSFIVSVLYMFASGSLVIRLKEKDVAAMLETGVGRMEIFKEIFAETVITAGLAYALVVAITLTLGKSIAKSILALMNTELENVAFADDLGVELILASGAVVLMLAFVAQLSSIGVLMRCKRPLK